MRAEIITIGDELLIGQVINTNASWLGQEFHQLGVEVTHMLSISDKPIQIEQAIMQAMKRSDIVLITGGLGPTNDDVTKVTLSKLFNSPLELHQPTLDHVTEIFKIRNLPMIESNAMQAMVPQGCVVLSNPSGTAPGMLFHSNNGLVISLPGVPFEMKEIFTNHVVSAIQSKFNLPARASVTLLTAGIGESFLAQKIQSFEAQLPSSISLAYLPSIGQVRLRLTAQGDNKNFLENELNNQALLLEKAAYPWVYGRNNDTLSSVIGRLLLTKKLTLATAESCSGGYVAHLITQTPGSSAYFLGSVVSYANEVKNKVLGVQNQTLEAFGAVSEQVVKEMAEGARRIIGADIGVSTSGIAGPDGGSAEKPVGTVWIAIAGPNGTIAKKFLFGNNRSRTIERTGITALTMLQRYLLGIRWEEA